MSEREPSVAIVVPRRAHPHRDQVWEVLRPKWATLPWPMFEVDHPGPELFNRAWCINRGAEQAGDFDVLLVIDSDVHVPHAQVYKAVELAAQTDQMTVAFDERYALAERATAKILAGLVPVNHWNRMPLEERCRLPGHSRCLMSNHNSNSHCVAYPRGLWDEMGGFDERFEGWGFEDMAVLSAALTLRGEPNRVPGRCYHLFHPRAQEREWAHPHYGINEYGGQRYFKAVGDPDAIRALIAERAAGIPLVPEGIELEVHEAAVEKRTRSLV